MEPARHSKLLGRVALAALGSPAVMIAAFPLLTGAPALGQRPVDKAWTTLQSGLAEKAADQRAAAVRVLGLLQGNAKAADFALTALGDEKPEVRSVTDALGQMQAKSALPRLVETVKTDKEVSVVMAGARAVIALGDPLGYAVYYAILTGQKKTGASLLESQKKMLNDPRKLAEFGSSRESVSSPLGGWATAHLRR